MSEKSSAKSLPHKQSKLSFKRKFDDITNSTESEAQAPKTNLKLRKINDQVEGDGQIVSISLNNTSNRDDLNTINPLSGPYPAQSAQTALHPKILRIITIMIIRKKKKIKLKIMKAIKNQIRTIRQRTLKSQRTQ